MPEALKRPEWPRPAASAIIFRSASVLIVERGKGAMPGTWSLPGGHIEPGEKAREAAARELFEETGLAVTLEGLVDVHDGIFRDTEGLLRAHYVLAVFWGLRLGVQLFFYSPDERRRYRHLDRLFLVTFLYLTGVFAAAAAGAAGPDGVLSVGPDRTP